MKCNFKRNYLFLFFCLFLSFLISGCAGGKGARKAIIPIKEAMLDSFTSLVLDAQNKENVPITSNAKERIINLITMKIKKDFPHRFKYINAESSDTSALHVTILFTRYDKGNAFARVMLAGLGQIHIDANVILRDSHQELLGKYEVKKTYAWGGLYGGTTRIEDVEDGFADAVVAVLLEEKKPETKKQR